MTKSKNKKATCDQGSKRVDDTVDPNNNTDVDEVVGRETSQSMYERIFFRHKGTSCQIYSGFDLVRRTSVRINTNILGPRGFTRIAKVRRGRSSR